MPDINTKQYYATRAIKAREMAEAATDPDIAEIHRRLGRSYAELVELTPGERPSLKVFDETSTARPSDEAIIASEASLRPPPEQV